ncbi:unnamed protein product [Dovyalis caffra]|uniref:Uncharacterized protein n=1 Tax=Dovyalis caffra TaxID=77055 RepID=A0AAV1S116_9ROSI|nr:unnamed protein product [Dovyalis caffra]
MSLSVAIGINVTKDYGWLEDTRKIGDKSGDDKVMLVVLLIEVKDDYGWSEDVEKSVIRVVVTKEMLVVSMVEVKDVFKLCWSSSLNFKK